MKQPAVVSLQHPRAADCSSLVKVLTGRSQQGSHPQKKKTQARESELGPADKPVRPGGVI